jgi:hypothetical protein
MATMFKDIQVDHVLKQVQENVAFAVNNSEICEADTADPSEFCWSVAINPVVSIPGISCPEGVC